VRQRHDARHRHRRTRPCGRPPRRGLWRIVVGFRRRRRAGACRAGARRARPGGGARGERRDQDLPTLVAKAVEMFESMATALSSGGDCPAQATRLRGLQDRYRPVIDAARKVETDGRGPEVEKLLVPHEERLKAAVEKMRPSVETCMQDPDFQRAFTELTGS
jgi:hypothetical protein